MPRSPLRRHAAALAIVAALAAEGAAAQLPEAELDPEIPVALVADAIEFDEAAQTVTATGEVIVYYGERTLTAAEIVYDAAADRIRATGPLTLRGEQGATVFADYAELDAELRDGVIRGARALVAEGAGRIAAVEGRRIEDRYTSLARAVYSACAVCPEKPTPLWAIRARRVVHDDVERMVFYEDAVFEILGAPVAYLPFFSHPDPTVERKTGFLAPTFSQSSLYGYALKAPYFVAIDESRDATITPFVTSDDGPILEAEFRQRTRRGGFDLLGSVGWLQTGEDGDGEARGHLFGTGLFEVGDVLLGRGAQAGFDIAATTDDGYLRRYGFSRASRLESELFVERYARNGFTDVSALYFQSLREGEDQDEIPVALPDFRLRRDLEGPGGFGEIGIEASGVALTRADGRDRVRLILAADWTRREILPIGLAIEGFARLRGDGYLWNDDARFGDGALLRLAPQAGIEAFYPLISVSGGVSHLIEPGAQLVVAPEDLNPEEVAAADTDEDSLISEFDTTNLFDRNRSTGFDRIESGARLNLGLRYARRADDPLTLDASFGRVFRITDDTAFSEGSGLSGAESDIIGSFGVGWGPWFTLENRFRLSDELDLNRNEVRGRLDVGRARLDGAYLQLEADATAGSLEDREEATLAAEIEVDPNWTLGGLVRRDLEAGEYVETAATLAFRNECASLELFIGRDFVDREDAPPSTNVGFRVRIFGAADGDRPRSGVCGPSP